MARTSNLQTNFLGGEWSPFFQGRADHKNYKTAMNVCRNSFPIEEGAWVRRPGSRAIFVEVPTQMPTGVKVYPVEFQADQPIDVLFTDGYAHFVYGNAPLLTPGLPTITSISTDTPAVLKISANTYNWANGDEVVFLFDNTTSGTVGQPIRGLRVLVLTQIDSTSFSLTDAGTNKGIRGDLLNLTSLAGITVGRLVRVVTPYALGSWSDIRIVQSQDFGVVLEGKSPAMVLTVKDFAFIQTPYAWLGPNYPIATANVALVPLVMLDGPYLDTVVDSSKVPSVLNWTGGTVTGPKVVSSSGSYPGGDPKGTIVATIQPNTTLYSYWVYIAKTTNSLGGGPLSDTSSPGGVIGDENGWAPTDPTGIKSQATGTITITAGFQLWKIAQYYIIDNCVDVVIAAVRYSYKAILPSVGVQPGVSGSWATYWALIDSGYAVTGLGNKPVGFQATDLGRMVRMFSTPADYDPTVKYCDTNTVYYSEQAYAKTGQIYSWDASAGVSPTTFTAPEWGELEEVQFTSSQTGIPDYNATTATLRPGWCPVVNATNWVWGRITTVTSSSVAVVTLDPGSAPMLWPLDHFQINTWRMGAFSATTGWPTCGSFYEGRFWFGGSIPNRFDTSQSDGWVPGNTVLDMAPTKTTGEIQTGFSNDGTVTDACGISYNLRSKDKNNIFWFEPDKGGILAGTLGGEWLISASELSDPITPTSIQAKRVTKYGCANIEPRRTGISLVFIQKFAHRVMEFLADVFTGRFIAPHLSETSKHLTVNTLQEVAYQEELAPILWFRDAVGGLIGATYRRVSAFTTEAPAFIGWHRHDLGDGFLVTSIGVNNTPTGTLDALSHVSASLIDGKPPPYGSQRFDFSKFTQLFDEDDNLSDAWFLDIGVVPDTMFEAGNPVVTNAGSFVVGTQYSIATVGSTDFTLIGAATNTSGVKFTATGVGAGTGNAGQLGVMLTGVYGLRTDGILGLTFTINGLDVGEHVVDMDFGTVFIPYGSGIAPAAIDYTASGAGAFMLTAAYIAANSVPPVIARNGSTATQTATSNTVTTTHTLSVQSFIPVAAVDGDVDVNSDNAAIDWVENLLMLPTLGQDGVRQFDAGTGVENVALFMDTITSGSGTGWTNDIGVAFNGKFYFGDASGNFVPLVRLTETSLALDYKVGTANSAGPPGFPGVVYPESMAINGGALLTSSSTKTVTMHQTANGAYVAGNTVAWTTDKTSSYVTRDWQSGFYVLNSGGRLYNATPVLFSTIGNILAAGIDAAWPTGAGLVAFAGVAVDMADNGILTYVQSNTQSIASYDAGHTYAIGDQVNDSNGAPIYTSLVGSNTGHTPSSSPTFWASTSTNYLIKYNVPGAQIIAGSFNIGQEYTILAISGTDFTQIGASVNVIGTVFTATGVGTGNGRATPTFKLAWKIPLTFVPFGTQDLMSQGPVINSRYAFLSPAGVATTVNSNTGAFTTKAIPGITLGADYSQSYDFNSNSIVFFGGYDSTITLCPAALNSTVTVASAWLRLYLGGSSTVTTITTTEQGLITCVGGMGYVSQGQILRPVTPDDTGAKAGPGAFKTRRSHLIGMLLRNTIGLEFGTDFGSTLQPAILKDGKTGNIGKQLQPDKPFSGMYRYPLKDDYGYDSMLAWQIKRPYPASVINVGAFLETQDL
jgi:hypothetical protein